MFKCTTQETRKYNTETQMSWFLISIADLKKCLQQIYLEKKMKDA